MSQHEKDLAFLKECILYDDSVERHKLEASITQLQHNERCVRRAVGLMAWLIALALAGLGYSVIFLTDFPQNVTQLITPFIVKVFCAVGGGSLICLVAFGSLGLVYRKELDQRREECRRLAARLLASHLGKPRAAPLRLTEANP